MKIEMEFKGAYLACENLHLMSCDFHDIDRAYQQDYSVVDISMENFDLRAFLILFTQTDGFS